MQSAEGTLIVFARVPVPGEVKTRLIPLLGAQAAADLYRQLLEHTVATACRRISHHADSRSTRERLHQVDEREALLYGND
jgi:glycosyltransferase A (GT-A) superfamily protein (DUF2064 family)